MVLILKFRFSFEKYCCAIACKSVPLPLAFNMWCLKKIGLGGRWIRADALRVRGSPSWVGLQDAFFNNFQCLLGSLLFSLGSIFPPNLHPQTHQNPSKIDAKMPSEVDDFVF